MINSDPIESIIVYPTAPTEVKFVPVWDNGCNSSSPQACFSYAFQLHTKASLIAARLLISAPSFGPPVPDGRISVSREPYLFCCSVSMNWEAGAVSSVGSENDLYISRDQLSLLEYMIAHPNTKEPDC